MEDENLTRKKLKGDIRKASSGDMDIDRIIFDVPATGTQEYYNCALELGGYRWSFSDMARGERGRTTCLGMGQKSGGPIS